MLDRFDAFIFVVPFATAFILWIQWVENYLPSNFDYWLPLSCR